MRKGLIVCAVLSGVLINGFGVSVEAQGKGKDKEKTPGITGCKSNYTLPNGAFIYKNSAPLRSGGVGTPLIGYRREPTLIMNRNFGRSGVTIYDTAGKKIGSCPWASAHGHAGGRHRCTMKTASLRKAALKAAGKKPTAIFKFGNNCVKVPDVGRCYGSVKGLCNQTITR